MLEQSTEPLEPFQLEQALREEVARRDQAERLRRYLPYPPQARFHALGMTLAERLLRAGNQQGKTYAGGMEMAMHLTGIYPDGWPGRRFDGPVEAWAACKDGEATRDNPQRVLVGPVKAWGTGTIPADCILETMRGRGVADLLDTVTVRHVSGGVSRLGFKRYDQGREAWQGPSKHVIWCDEEPPEDVYSEALARLIATGGMIYTTFTPLNGMSAVVTKLINGPGDVNMMIEDAAHIPAAERAAIIARFPEHEREARARGVPLLGGGLVFPISEGSIKCDPFDVPAHWPRIGALDFGWDHPFAAVELAWDRDADCVYVVRCYRVREQTPKMHAMTLRTWHDGKLLFVWPHDGHAHDKGSGVALANQYRAERLRVHFEHATHAKAGGYGFEAGVMDMLDRMKTNRLKVFAPLSDWFDEFRHYHRKDGLVVKERDDLLSATRIGLMMLRFARVLDFEHGASHTAFANYNPLDGAPNPNDAWSPEGGFRRRESNEWERNPLN